MRRIATTAVALAVAIAGLAAQNQRPNAIPAEAATRDGWWIRLNPFNQADNVSWRFGVARSRLGTPLRWWRDEQPNEFDVPTAERGVKVLHLAAFGIPYKERVSFCVFYQDQGVALVEFAGEKALQVDQDQREPACVR